ncbi:hypothetical protein PENSPDRAFT_754325 [Peniophora sp. CONT]|nr:hypothetical protein PENSPDRAFT_754325 [Peniophora sp. CONT]
MPSAGNGDSDVDMDTWDDRDYATAYYKALIPHVFLPPRLPAAEESEDDMREASLLLCKVLFESAKAYKDGVPEAERTKWDVVARMISSVEKFLSTTMTRASLVAALQSMKVGDVLPLHIRAQNAAVIVRKNAEGSSFEVFEPSSSNEAVYSTPGKLVISYPGPAVQVPEAIIENLSFRDNLALFLSSMDVDELDSAAEATKAGSTVREVRDTTDPRYISQLLVGILLGCFGATDADVTRVTKRIADEVIWDGALKPWRRLPLWLILRVALQTTLVDRNTYKAFMAFFMTRVLNNCVKLDKQKLEGRFSSDILDIMRKKIARRLAKLGDAVPEFVMTEACALTDEDKRGLKHLLDKRWKDAQKPQRNALLQFWAKSMAGPLKSFEGDVKLVLKNASPHLAAPMNRDAATYERTAFNPSYPQRLKGTLNFDDFTQRSLATAIKEDTPTLVLADFEEVVRDGLRAWAKEHAAANGSIAVKAWEMSCDIVFELSKQYRAATLKHYISANPEDQSIAVLTQIALWAAIDRFVIRAYPLLEDYSPEVPATFLEPLVLRDERDIRLANELEAYVRARHARARPGAISVFTASSDEQSFVRRLYAQDPCYANLKTRIEDAAKIERQNKCFELRRDNEKYARLKAEAERLDHTRVMVWVPMYTGNKRRRGNVQVHASTQKHEDPSCRRCQLENKMSAMQIEVHEWPLPERKGEAEEVIVELLCPPIYSMWRDTTYDLLTQTGKITEPSDAKDVRRPAFTSMLWRNYTGLKGYNLARTANVVLGSLSRSFTSTHYEKVSLPTTEDKVCVNNGLSCAYVDRREGGFWVGTIPYSTSSVAHLCSPKLPVGSRYAHLQHTIDGTEHTSNEAIADQASCPKDLSLHEHLSFASIRSGGRLQWLNIARELRARTLTHNAPEVHLLLTQAMWQLGPLEPDGAAREWHLELSDPVFCGTVLGEAASVLQSVGENWKEAVTVQTIVLIVLRILEASQDVNVCNEARAVVRSARGIAAHFRDALKERMVQLKGASEEIRQLAQRQICEAAATCVSTYDVSLDDHLELLLYSAEDVSEFVRSAVLAQEHLPPDIARAPLHTQLLLRRYERALRRTESRLRTCILRQSAGMHAAVLPLWSSYRADGHWHALETPSERQISYTFTHGGVQQTVHYDLLTGTLLIGGRRVNKLPPSITTHKVFARLFGQMLLDIVPAADPEMEYETKQTISDWTVSFALRPGNILLIRARSAPDENGRHRTLELIPHDAFHEDLPQTFVQDYVHWLDLSTGDVEFRPKSSPWLSSEGCWCLTGLREGTPQLRHGLAQTRLVDPHSGSFQALHVILGVLELPQFMIVTVDSGKLCAELPRLRLRFKLDSERRELVCESIHGMVVDYQDQSSGVLTGLRNQLVLRVSAKDRDKRMLPGSRRVIIPYGDVHFSPAAHSHVSVSIQVDVSASQVAYYDYWLDQDLRCVAGASSITARLFLCYLHAVTSSCLPDPLTGLTGTEQALDDLNNARMLSFRSLSSVDVKILKSIAALTPNRVFFPRHLAAMQQVTWSSLPSLSQHTDFQRAVDCILEYARDMALFYEDRTESDVDLTSATGRRDEKLVERAARRSAVLYAPDTPFNANKPHCDDLRHEPRHSLDLIAYDTGASVASVAHLAREMQAPAHSLQYSDFNLLEEVRSHAHISAQSSASLSYSATWLRGPDVWNSFLSFYRLCSEYGDGVNGSNRFQLVFSLCSFAFEKPGLRSTVFLLLALCLNDAVRRNRPAELYGNPHLRLALKDGTFPNQRNVHDLLVAHCPKQDSTPADKYLRLADEEQSAYAQRKQRENVRRVPLAREEFTNLCMAHWPNMDFHALDLAGSTNAIPLWLRNTQTGIDHVQIYMQRCKLNAAFEKHINSVQAVLRSVVPVEPDVEMLAQLRVDSVPPVLAPQTTASFAQLLLKGEPPEITTTIPSITPTPSARSGSVPASTANLRALVTSLDELSDSTIQRTYLHDLKASIDDLESTPPASPRSLPRIASSSYSLRLELEKQRDSVRKSFNKLHENLGPRTAPERQLDAAGLWPKVSERTVLKLLSKEWIKLVPEKWRHTLGLFGRSVLAYQRLQRLLGHVVYERPEEALKELENATLDDTVGLLRDHPDWMLIQIDSNFLSRPVQRSIAQEMIAPSSGQNSLLQLNMGEGKSSVIVPFTVAALANGESLVRVVVLKALSNTMFDLLADRLGGLVNRRIFYLPFSRSLKVTQELVDKMKAMYETCLRVGGVLVIQPEHILSFKLMGLDYLMSRSPEQLDHAVASSLWESQRWVSTQTRDILDESDELLHARYQLIYTMGLQQPVDGHPHRWMIIQQVLLVLRDCVSTLAAAHPRSILFRSEPGARFPTIRLLNSDVDAELTRIIIDRIMSGAVHQVSFSTLSGETKAFVADFIGSPELSDATSLRVRRDLSEHTWKGVLLLRGLLAPGSGVLLYVLKHRRWRVDFGLDLTRSLLAVPYRAKDTPSLRAEFGHPDVAILLTCFSYCYGGLTSSQVVLCFSQLFKMDDPRQEYAAWVSAGGGSVPVGISELSGVNLEDETLVESKLVPTFSFNYAVVYFFVTNFVFPREAKEFPNKLGSSSWDLAERKPKVTTGFSGTKDNRFLLPTSISQKDMPEQRGTDALVLSHMLQPENTYSAYTCTQSGEEYLGYIVKQEPEIRVLLDVGAQMLDMKNEDLARFWLKLSKETVCAAIFFTDADDLAVVTRDGVVELLRYSPYNEQLDKCIVYLDDAHTRGTDLKLPKTYRAALTLGQKVTKDRLVQGAMRMRKLGFGQSLLILAPPDIDSAIQKATRLAFDGSVSVRHVLQWAMLETCEDIARHIPHWAEQGVDYAHRRQAQTAFEERQDLGALKHGWLKPEARTLDEMYGTTETSQANRALWKSIQEIEELRVHLTELGVTSVGSARLTEEQEREVVLEVERERQVQRPPKVDPAPHSLHPDVLAFARTGHIPPHSQQIASLFEPLQHAGDAWDRRLLATRDFAITLATAEPLSTLHDYMRPVSWVLSWGFDDDPEHARLVVVSPYEANHLLPILRTGASGVRLHVFTPRLIKTMPSVSDMRFHVIPALPADASSVPRLLCGQLGLWAGELWLDDEATYRQLCAFLGLYMGYTTDEIRRLQAGGHIGSDGFVGSGGRGLLAVPSVFQQSPVNRLRELLAYRRKSVDYMSTHIGKILSARELRGTDWTL